MKWCVHFPDEDILIKRPCLKKACLGNKAAAAFLSYLLYKVSISQEFRKHTQNLHQQNPDSDTHAISNITITLHKSQKDIIAEMDHEISDRTLRDIAIPLLVALGYIHIDDTDKATLYTVQLATIQQSINRSPKRAEILPLIQQRLASSNLSAKQRKYLQRVTELFPQATENLPTSGGNTSGEQNSTHPTSEEHSEPSVTDDKSREKKSSPYKKKEESTIYPALSHNNTPYRSASNTHQTAITTHKPQRPANSTTKTGETILQLTEFLRTCSFSTQERPHQLQAANALLTIVPHLSLQELEEVWLHGSDNYWRTRYDPHGMTITDLVAHNKHGKHRVIAILEHKRRQQTSSSQAPGNKKIQKPHSQTHLGVSSLATSLPRTEQKSLMTEQQAIQLANQVLQSHHTGTYNIQAQAHYEQEAWVVQVQIGDHSLTLHHHDEWAQELAGIARIMQARQKLDSLRK